MKMNRHAFLYGKRQVHYDDGLKKVYVPISPKIAAIFKNATKKCIAGIKQGEFNFK